MAKAAEDASVPAPTGTMPSPYHDLHSEQRRGFLGWLLAHERELSAEVMHTSNILTTDQLTWWRSLVCCFCVVTSLIGWARNTRYPFFRYRFLTIWSFDILTLYFGLAALCGWNVLRRRETGTRWTGMRNVAYISFELGFCAAMAVTALYWSLIYPGEPPKDSWQDHFTNPVVHAFNSVFVIMELGLCRMLFYRRHMILCAIYAITYLVFNLVYSVAFNTYIYKVLRWDTAARTTLSLGYFLGGTLFMIGCFLIARRFARWRDQRFGKAAVSHVSAHHHDGDTRDIALVPVPTAHQSTV